jgi:hypothetical protein
MVQTPGYLLVPVGVILLVYLILHGFDAKQHGPSPRLLQERGWRTFWDETRAMLKISFYFRARPNVSLHSHRIWGNSRTKSDCNRGKDFSLEELLRLSLRCRQLASENNQDKISSMQSLLSIDIIYLYSF